MRILVCVKQVPATSQVEVDEQTGVLRRDGAAAKLNPYDLYALEMALRLREKGGGSVTALSMGPPQAEAALREAIAIGADDAVLLTDRRFAGADVLATARALAGAVWKMGVFDLILCGKQTTDGDTAQVGPELAECLGMEHASYVQRAELSGGALVAEVNLGEGTLRQRMPLPCLLTIEKDANTPRLPSYRRSLTMDGRRITRLTLDDLTDQDPLRYGLDGSPTQVERIFPPEARQGRQMLRGTAEEVAGAALEILLRHKFI